MNIIIVCSVLLFQLLSFFSFGLLLFKLIKITPTSITITLFSGFIFYFCIFGIITIPLILTFQPLSLLTTIIISVTFIGIIVALLLCRHMWLDLVKTIPATIRLHSYTLSFIIIVVLFQQLAVFTHIDNTPDGSYYIGKVTTDVYTNTMGLFDPYTGNKLYALDSRRVFACFQEYNAVISQFFQIHPLKQAKLIMPTILSLFTSILYYHIGMQLFHNNPKKVVKFMWLLFFLDLYNNTIYTSSSFLLLRTYEGKSILANILIPGILLYFLYLCKDYNTHFPKIMLLLLSFSSCFFSSSSMLIVPVELTAGLLPLIIRERSKKGLLYYFLCIIPNLIIVSA